MRDTTTVFKSSHSDVILKIRNRLLRIVLNRPMSLNSLTLEMILAIKKALVKAEASPDVRMILLEGAGDKAFCAGGDIKSVAEDAKANLMDRVYEFFDSEYSLDLYIHNYKKPVIVIADGITMGGGLGLAAGANVVVATEKTRIAMPESRIGFFPDVGATGWLFKKCPLGYPEYLGLTGYEMIGEESVRVGLATHLIPSRDLPETVEMLERISLKLPDDNNRAMARIFSLVDAVAIKTISSKPEMDEWVRSYFANQTSVRKILDDLAECSIFSNLCEGVFSGISERSPTALVLTLRLLRCNEHLPLKQVFENETKAVRFIVKHPDFYEGVRARLVEKDDKPRWLPDSIDDVEILGVDI